MIPTPETLMIDRVWKLNAQRSSRVQPKIFMQLARALSAKLVEGLTSSFVHKSAVAAPDFIM
jgi:hypothetical protein